METNNTRVISTDERSEIPAAGDGRRPLILVITPDNVFLQFVTDTFLSQGWATAATTDPAHAVQTFFELKPDLVIMDAYAKKDAGSAALDAIREHAETVLLPLMNAGDFRGKAAEELIAVAESQLDMRRRIDELALLDGLSGMYNRKYFSIEMSRQLNDLRRTREPFTIVMMDMDGTREINSRFGYAEGDRTIRHMGRFVKERVRCSDVLARIDADRFVLILPKTYAENAMTLVRRLQNEFAAARVDMCGEASSCTFSAGLLEVIDVAWDEAMCVRMAESALQGAKSEGGNVSRIFRLQDEREAGWMRHLNLAIVEDDDLIRNLLEKRLPEIGGAKLALDIRSYKDGEYFFADEWHNGKGQFLIILDRNMPRMNGMEVVRRLRSGYDRSRYQILMLTAVNSEAGIAQAIEAGVDDYMTKPFSLVELESRILRLVKGLKR
ncbi:diguanylate cyclase [Paenibacillus beijingensis]|uniref:Diguanylate cyclase n=1 Tax=Paenibacillus beijingensis TaxID=1126833 RepID=A0A0D5NFT2_9BACL|nr:diguanylate cyclase [Paenibacillus beijingensis]AJY74106.1 hypothetical protein VN24_05190 [Paenibacillus beijingensis]